MGLKIDAAVCNHIGGRANNEDNFFLNGTYMTRERMNAGGEFSASCGDRRQIYAVCDGMGGAEFGEEASLRAAEALSRYRRTCPRPDDADELGRMIEAASRQVDDVSLSRGMPSGSSGSTLAMLVADDYCFRAVHVGDSRVYRLRAGRLERLTRDHSEVQRLLDLGLISEEQAWRHPQGNIITQHLGMPAEPNGRLRPEIGPRLELMAGDRFLLASDGLTDVVPDNRVQQLLEACRDPRQAASTLVGEALAGAKYYGVPSDNVTVMVVDVLSAGTREGAIRRRRALRLVQQVSAAAAALSAGGLCWLCVRMLTRGG